MEFMFEWEADGDRFSFEDSDRFEDDSLCSWISEPESLCNNWRGWRKPNCSTGGAATGSGCAQSTTPSTQACASSRDNRSNAGQSSSLVELTAQAVARHIPFEVVEHFRPPVPEQLQLRIAFWSFPENEEDIRLYSCLANGSADEFQKGEQLFKSKSVSNALQIGFHLSASVLPPQSVTHGNATVLTTPGDASNMKGAYNVALVFDRRHITSCSCSCTSGAAWCAHVVALCLFRIHQAGQVRLRAPVSESLSRLERDQLQKFAQYLISAMPQQILPTAQRLLDELLSSQQTTINTVCGAPDPTAGPSATDPTTWCLDDSALHENIKKTLSKFCVPSPMVLSDVNYLSNSAPPAATEWQTILRPLRGREPEGIWNLLSIVREMFRRNDSNAVTLLDIITEELLGCDQILAWWFNNKTGHQHGNAGFHGNRGGGQGSGGGTSSTMAAHAAAGLCDEVVALWRLATLNPSLSIAQRTGLSTQLMHWQTQCLDRLRKAHIISNHPANSNSSSAVTRRSEWESSFFGFKPAIEACQLDWSGIALPAGVSELVRSRGPWSSGSSVQAVGSRSVLMPGQQEAAFVDGVVGDTSYTDSHCVVRLKEPRRKVLMPSERSHHAIVCPWNYTSHKTERDPSMASGDSDAAARTDRDVVKAAVSSGSADEQLCYESSKSLTAGDRSSGEASKVENQSDILFALAEALHTHGYTKEACKLARQLAEEMLSTGASSDTCSSYIPVADHSAHSVKGDKARKVAVVSFAGSTLAKVSFLCTVLLEEPETRHLAFRIGLYGMEMTRPPAVSKSLEVKLAYQESELASQLKKLPLGAAELALIRDRAEKLRDGRLKTRGDALLPVVLASFIFDSLCASQAARSSQSNVSAPQLLTAQDEKLGFEAAVAALGLKGNVSEAEHPLLCEGTRRQKGELAVAMLVQYKDDTAKLARIMDKLLDKEVHQLFKASPSDPEMSNYVVSTVSSSTKHGMMESAASEEAGDGLMLDKAGDEGLGADCQEEAKAEAAAAGSCPHGKSKSKSSALLSRGGDGSTLDDDTEGSGDFKAWEAKFRCTNLRTAKKHSVGMASVDSSAPETTSSDNSPTLVRRNFTGGSGGAAAAGHHAEPGSDSGSSQSDSVESSSSGCKRFLAQQAQQLHRALKAEQMLFKQDADADNALANSEASSAAPVYYQYSRTAVVNGKGARYKSNKSRIMPSLPNQPSEASAHFMFELAKTVLVKAGGNSSTSLFINQSPATSNTQTHRALHLCAFQIGLYALGLNNCVSPNWLSRTYSSHVSWITGQAIEIGYQAIEVLIKTWEGHLTPQEAASLADRASRCRDPHMVRSAAELALSCLPHAHALNPQEISRALLQCKEQSSDMLQRACLSVENTAKEGGVCPEVLFEVAKRWYELYEERTASSNTSSHHHHSVSAALVSSTAAVSMAFPGHHHDINMPVPPVAQPPVADSITLMQMAAPSNGTVAAMNGSMGSYQPGAVSFVPPQQMQLMPHVYGPYTYVHPMASGNQPSSVQARPNFPFYAVPVQQHNPPVHLARCPYQGQYMTSAAGPSAPSVAVPPPVPQTVAVAPAYLANSPAMYHAGMPSVRAPVQFAYLAPMPNLSVPPMSSSYGGAQPVEVGVEPSSMNMAMQQQQHANGMDDVAAGAEAAVDDIHINYLLATFRVGMLAMETLAKRVHDDRPHIKYGRNPPHGEEVKWLLSISCKLGTSYLQQYCTSVVNAIVSPFVLLDIAMESASFLAVSSVSQVTQQIRLPLLNSLLQKCLQMFGMCTQTRLHHIAPTDYEDFVSIVCSARNAFYMVPGGMTQFNDMLQSIRRSKYCKKDLWQRVISGLHSTNSV